MSRTITFLESEPRTNRKQRGWLDILVQILVECSKGSIKTRIVYDCNLNFKQTQQYLTFLVERGLLDGMKDGSRAAAMYYTTDLGKSFIGRYEQLRDILRPKKSQISNAPLPLA